MTEIVPFAFAFEGYKIRVELDPDGLPWWVTADVCSALDIANVGNAVNRLDQADVRTTDVRSSGQRRAVKVVNESGLFDLILDSRKPNARRFRRWVTSEVLPQIRRTGSYSVTPAVPDLSTPAGVLVLAEQFAKTARQLVAAEQRAAELEPSAHRWDTLVNTEGDHLVGDAAKYLRNDRGVDTGPQRLFEQLQTLGWIYRTTEHSRWRAKQSAIEAGRLRERPVTRLDPDTGKRVAAPPQVRVTFKGIEDLHKALTAGQAIARRAGAA